MGIFQQFPYTNFHEMNLDWVIKLIKQLDSDFDALSDEVKNFILDVATAIQNEVDEWLTEHPEATTTVQDNSLNINKFVEALQSDVIGSQMVDELNMHRFPYSHIINDGTYTSSQGICVVDDYLIITRFLDDESPVRYYVVDIENKAVVGTYDYVTNHNNSLTYADGYLYTIYGTSLCKMPFNNGVIGAPEMETLSMSFSAAAFDSVDNVFYLLHADTQTVYSTTDFVTFTQVFQKHATSNQGMCVIPDGIVFLNSSLDNVEEIYIYSRKGTFIKSYELPRKTYGEIEDIAAYNGNFFINFQQVTLGNSVYCVPYRNDTVITGYNKITDTVNGIFKSDGTQNTIYIDNSNTVAFPDGTNSNPFNDIHDAMLFAMVSNITNLIFNIKGTYSSFTIGDLSVPCTLNFDNCTIGNMSIIRCSQVILQGVATIKTLALLTCTVFASSSSINFIGDGSSNQVAVTAYRAIINGYLGNMTTYTGGVRGLNAIINLGLGTLTAVSNTKFATSSSIVYINGTAI